MLNWLKDKSQSVRAGLAAEVAKFKNREFMEAVVAGCAMIAAADGDISREEKQKMMGYVGNAAELKHFDSKKVIEFFNQMTNGFDFDAAIGRAEALKVIGKIKGREDQARMLVRVICVIGASDGDFDEAERAVARQICGDLGLNPADFDL